MLETIKVAFIITSHAVMGVSPSAEPTGVWLEELTTPYYLMVDAGYEVELYTIDGGLVPIDPRSLKPAGENEDSVERYLDDTDLQAVFETTLSVDAVQPSNYDVIFLPGGHGTMWDYPESDALQSVIEYALTHDIVTASVCHGPAGLTTAVDAEGNSLLAGRTVSAFTNSEEDAAGFTDEVPFLLETRLKDIGANYVSGPDFAPFAVRDGLLVTGQNPASAGRVTELIIEAIAERESSTLSPAAAE